MERNWKKTIIELGEVKENSKTKFNFEALRPLEIEIVKPGCGGCTTVGKFKESKLPVTFKANRIPKHFANTGKTTQPVTKSINITYKDGFKELLMFRAKIVK